MLAILNSLDAPNFPIFQPILMILVSKFMVHATPSDKPYFSLELLYSLRVLSRILYLSRICEKTLNNHAYINLVGLLLKKSKLS